MRSRPSRHLAVCLILALLAFGLGWLLVVTVLEHLSKPARAGSVSGSRGSPATLVLPVDPGVRGGAPGAGGAISGLTAPEADLFLLGKDEIEEVVSVSGAVAGEPGSGLGPRFNSNSCVSCHMQPAVGGTSPAANPLFGVAQAAGAANQMPDFIHADGPVRELRFVSDGGVRPLFTVVGRSDAPEGCTQAVLQQPTPAGQIGLRIPTPLFGLGLVAATSDASLVSAQAAANPAGMGITNGVFNRDQTTNGILRFGWKAHQGTLLGFAGEAYNVEMGVSNEVSTVEVGTIPVCSPNPQPEDTTPAGGRSDIAFQALFMAMTAPPTPVASYGSVTAGSVTAGASAFASVGCGRCHVASQTSAPGQTIAALSSRVYAPFSDFALHDMGEYLADGITQIGATGRLFRTAPLWGAGQRVFFLHDGRARDLVAAVLSHKSGGSEASQVITAFMALPLATQQDIINFLRSL